MAKARHRLKALRKQRGFTQESLAQHIGVGVTTVRDWEQGNSTPGPENRRALEGALKVSDAVLAILLEDYEHAINGHRVPSWLGHLASLEQGAAELRAFEPVVIHSLLQTEGYATEVERVGGYNEDEVAQRVQVRMARQRVLRSLRLHVILDESVFSRVAGDDEVMAGQLEHLADTDSERTNVTVQVLPLGAKAFLSAFGAFKILTSQESAAPFMAYVEDSGGPHYLDRQPEIDRHVTLFERLSRAALEPAESIEFIQRVRKERYL